MFIRNYLSIPMSRVFVIPEMNMTTVTIKCCYLEPFGFNCTLIFSEPPTVLQNCVTVALSHHLKRCYFDLVPFSTIASHFPVKSPQKTFTNLSGPQPPFPRIPTVLQNRVTVGFISRAASEKM